jgi:hypothetical protein
MSGVTRRILDKKSLLDRAHEGKRELWYLEFKEQFDPSVTGEWIELVKDFIAIANSGGGVVVVGATNSGEPSGFDVQPVLDLDGATIADKVFRWTSEHWAGFEIEEITRNGHRLAAVVIDAVTDAPIAFNQTARYRNPQGKEKTAFTRGSIYFRHGAKSEPATRDDLREFIERRLGAVRSAWLEGITKLVAAPEGFELARIREIDKAGQPTRIQLTSDPDAPVYGRLSHDETHPYRMTDLLSELRERRAGNPSLSEYDIRCVRRVNAIDEKTHPQFCVQPKYSSMQYSDAFLAWLEMRYKQDAGFFEKAKSEYYHQVHH